VCAYRVLLVPPNLYIHTYTYLTYIHIMTYICRGDFTCTCVPCIFSPSGLVATEPHTRPPPSCQDACPYYDSCLRTMNRLRHSSGTAFCFIVCIYVKIRRHQHTRVVLSVLTLALSWIAVELIYMLLHRASYNYPRVRML